MSFFDKYVQKLENEYPRTAKAVRVRDLLSENLICPHVIELPSVIREKANAAVEAFFELRESKKYQSFVGGKLYAQAERLHYAGNYSALMCFDFHWTEEKKLKLIEINTNASVGLIGDLLYKAHETQDPFTKDFRAEILATFKAEFELVRGGQKLNRAVIVDEQPEQQRLFIEFLLYQELFESGGIDCEINDTTRLTWEPQEKKLFATDGKTVDLVYNRDTNFFLDKAPSIKNAWLANATVITPNPTEYALLADKQRLEEISRVDDLSTEFAISAQSSRAIKEVLLKTQLVNELGEEAWTQRKNLFFKPKHSFGGKAVYKGASVSRTMFDKQIASNGYLAQELAVPSQVSLTNNGKTEDFKFDLRFFVYKNKIQQAVARVYQGQTTNAQTPGGGIAAIAWK